MCQSFARMMSQNSSDCLNDTPIAVPGLNKHAGVCISNVDTLPQHLHRDHHMHWLCQIFAKLFIRDVAALMCHAASPSSSITILNFLAYAVAVREDSPEPPSLLHKQVCQTNVGMVFRHSWHSDVVVAQDTFINGLAHGVAEIRFIRVGRRESIPLLVLRHSRWQGMVGIIAHRQK